MVFHTQIFTRSCWKYASFVLRSNHGDLELRETHPNRRQKSYCMGNNSPRPQTLQGSP